MKTTGIIAEYNPFHNGHKYHLEQTRIITGADYIIAVMGGDYAQRGTPAISDKFSRAKMALLGGADLVLELPLFYSAGSAEFFAMGAVSLLDKLGITDSICFGSECGDIHTLSAIAGVLSAEPDNYRSTLQHCLRNGYSYPKARSIALADCFSYSEEYAAAVASPNNILGIEYLKALDKRKSSIVPYTLLREGAAYHDTSLFLCHDEKDSIPKSSASAIRDAINNASDIPSIKAHVPDSTYDILHSLYNQSFPVTSNDFSVLLHYKLLLESEKGYSEYMDIGPDLSDKIIKNMNRFENFEQFCNLLKSKDLTYSRLSRCLLHILLDMKKTDMASYIEKDYISYARILGFRKESAPLLRSIKDCSSIPLISKLADAAPLLDTTGNSMLSKDIRASHIYDTVIANKFHTPFINEYEKQLIIL